MKRSISLFFIVLFSVVNLAFGSDVQAGQYLLYLKSEPGDFIGQGQEFSVSDTDVTFTASRNFDNGVSLSMLNFDVSPPIWWYADFAAPFAAPLAVGAYENATRFPFQADTEPGLSIYGDGRGCNTLTGRFDVREIDYGTSDEILSFAADFEQHCEGMEPALLGAIRFNSDIPLPTFGPANGAPLTGSLHVFDPQGNDLCVIPGNCGDPVTGSYDAAAGKLAFDPIFFFGAPLVASSVELLSVGTHTRSDGFGGTITATVNPGQVGAYVTFMWSGNVLPTLMVWDVAGAASSQTFTPVDSDGDGILGHAQTGGPFVGFSGIYEFTVTGASPDIELGLNVTGGTDHECTSTDGATVEIMADISLVGGALLDSIDWSVDGNPAGSGNIISPNLGLGTHTISATASTTTGESDSKSIVVNVIDTTAPVIDVAFVDSRSGESITEIDQAKVQWVRAHFVATDICDSNPTTTAVGGFSIQNGDLLKIQGMNNTVMMTTPELSLVVTATDASANTSVQTATIQITQ
jgi:hypothetical protein